MKRSLLFAGLLVALFVFSSRAEEEEKEEKDDIGTVIGIDLGTTYSW